MPHMRAPRAGERRSGRLRGRGECARGVQVVAGEEDRWGARDSPVEPPVGISDKGEPPVPQSRMSAAWGIFLSFIAKKLNFLK